MPKIIVTSESRMTTTMFILFFFFLFTPMTCEPNDFFTDGYIGEFVLNHRYQLINDYKAFMLFLAIKF